MLTFGVLGPLEVRAEGDEIPLPGHQLRTLLALLLSRPGRVVSTADLTDALWGTAPPPGADKTVQTYLTRLRRALDADRADGMAATIATRAPGYCLLIDPQTVDAVRFTFLSAAGRSALASGEYQVAAARLREALDLWRGDAYAEFADTLALRAEVNRLEELRLLAIEDQFEADLAVGGGAELVPELEKILADEPLRERLWGHLVVALYRAGRQADALAAFRRARGTLVDGLGIEPSVQLQDLHTQVLAHDRALLAPRCATSRRPPPDGPRLPTSPPRRRPRRWRRRVVIGAVSAAAVLAVSATAALLTSDSRHRTFLRELPPNSVGVLDSDGAVLGSVAVGTDPTGLGPS